MALVQIRRSYMKATELFINNAEFVGIAIFFVRSLNNSVEGIINLMP